MNWDPILHLYENYCGDDSNYADFNDNYDNDSYDDDNYIWR